MALASMIATDEDSLICDLAETYGIFNYRSLPVNLVATLSVGLRADSRIKMKLFNLQADIKTILLAGICDELNCIIWMQQGSKNGKPKSVLMKLLNEEREDTNEIISYDSPDMYWTERKRMLGGGQDGE